MNNAKAAVRVFFALIVSFHFASQSGAVVKEVTFCNMGEVIQEIRSSAIEQSELMKSYLVDKQFVFVSGYLGCNAQEFTDNIAAIKRVDKSVPSTTVCPPSPVAIEDNVPFLIEKLRAAAKKYPKRKIVLVGQSKGGAEALQTAALNTKAFTPEGGAELGFTIADVVTLNGAIGGAYFADVVLDLNPPILEKWREYMKKHGITNEHMDAIKKILQVQTPGFKSLVTETSLNRTDDLRERLSLDEKKILAEHVLFVTSYRLGREDDIPPMFKGVADFMNTVSDQHDALLRERDQRVRGLGTHFLRIRDASHFSLTGPIDKAPCREEFMKVVLLSLANRLAVY